MKHDTILKANSSFGITKSTQIKEVRNEIAARLTEREFKLIKKSPKKVWAIKPITKNEIELLVREITTLLEVVDIDGGTIRPVLSWSYALLNEKPDGSAAGISIEI